MSAYLEPVLSSDTLPDFNPFPEGVIAGCRARKSEYGSGLFPMASQQIKLIPSVQWPDYAEGASSRPRVKTVFSQGSAGSCASEASYGAYKIAREFVGMPFIEFNPLFTYLLVNGNRNRGSSIDENLSAMQRFGCCPESAWSRKDAMDAIARHGWGVQPPEEAFSAAIEYNDVEAWDIASKNEMVSALVGAMPVVHGANGHAVCAVEHVTERSPLSLNSWGDDWKDDGFGVWASYAAINWAYGAFAIRAVR